MTDMGRKNWSDPEVAKPMLDKIPLGKFAGNSLYQSNFSSIHLKHGKEVYFDKKYVFIHFRARRCS